MLWIPIIFFLCEWLVFPTSQRVLRDLPTIIRHKKGGFLQVEAIHPRVPNWSSNKKPPDMIADKIIYQSPICVGLLPITCFRLDSPSSLLKPHVDEDRQGPSLLALLNGPVDPRGDSNIFWAGPHGSNYVYKVGLRFKRTGDTNTFDDLGEFSEFLWSLLFCTDFERWFLSNEKCEMSDVFFKGSCVYIGVQTQFERERICWLFSSGKQHDVLWDLGIIFITVDGRNPAPVGR